MHWAARNGHTEVCIWLRRPSDVQIEINPDTVYPDTEAAAVGLDVDACTTDGTVAFHWACWQGQFGKLLLPALVWLYRCCIFCSCCHYLYLVDRGCSSLAFFPPDRKLHTRFVSVLGQPQQLVVGFVTSGVTGAK